MSELKLQTIPIKNIRPYPNNPRKNDGAVDAVAESIRQCGYVAPIIVDENMTILAGHTRYKALKKLGYSESQAIIKTGLSEEQKRKYRLLDNKTNELAEWDWDLLRNELDGLDFENLDLDWGPANQYDQQCNEILDDKWSGDDYIEPRCKPGDVWILGRHRVMCGDSTKPDDVQTLIADTDNDTVFIDPPYDQESLYAQSIALIPDCKTLLVSYSHMHFGAGIMAALGAGYKPQYELIWDCVQSWYTPNRPLARHKTIAVFGDSPDWNFESAIIHDGKQRKAHKVHNTRGNCDYKPLDESVHLRTIEPFPNTNENDENGHGKPVKWLAAIFAGRNTKNLLDLFGGSGASLIAAEQIGAQCRMMEIDPHSMDNIIARWEKFTGEKAILDERQ